MNSIDLALQFKNYTGFEFEKIYTKHRPKLVWYLTKYTKEQEISEDFADDAFIQALHKITSFNREKSQIHTWIYKIAENLVKKDFKDRKRLGTTSLDNPYESSECNNLINIFTNGDVNEMLDVEADAVVYKKAEIIKNVINTLPLKYRKVMIMRELNNNTYLEIADLCAKYHRLSFIQDQEDVLSTPEDFMEIILKNKSDVVSFIEFTQNDGVVVCFNIEPKTTLKINKSDIKNIKSIKVIANGLLSGVYKTSTNLSTVKSQILKGRQLIQEAVRKRFKKLDEHGIK